MLPLGLLGVRGNHRPPHYPNITLSEMQTMLTLWSIFKSPLIIGGDFSNGSALEVYNLLTNPETIIVDQGSIGNSLLYATGSQVAWVADGAYECGSKYVALFNIGSTTNETLSISLSELLLNGTCIIRDLWARQNIGSITTTWNITLTPHSCAFISISGCNK